MASGLTEAEAKEVHKTFVSSFIAFTVVAIIAHVLVWQWRPWLPGEQGYAALDTNAVAATAVTITQQG